MAITTVGRTTIQGATTVGGFNPATLFSAGEQGVWYDPSDFSTLFQDSAGTIPVTALEQPVGRMLDKSGRGNHATQATSANRPVVSARVNLLTQSNNFTSTWTASNLNGNPSQTILAPDGTVSAWVITENNANGIHGLTQSSLNYSFAGNYTISCFISAKAGSAQRFVIIQGTDAISNGVSAVFNPNTGAFVTYQSTGSSWVAVSNSSTSLGNGWYFVSFTFTAPARNNANASVLITSSTSSSWSSQIYTGDNSSGVNIYGADLRPTNQGVGLPVYQRVGAATYGTSTTAGNADYNANGFPVYLSFDGANDSLATGNINFSGTNKMSVFVGERKTSDVNQGMLAELSVAGASNNGTFSLFAPVNAGIGNYGFRSRGDGTTGVAATASSYPAPITNILTGIGDIAADNMTLRVNGSVAATDTGDQGTGNFGTYPIYIGARAGTSQYFNGNLYGLIVRGASSTANQITGAENWLNQKTAAY